MWNRKTKDMTVDKQQPKYELSIKNKHILTELFEDYWITQK